jgi:hypothetical protein
MEQECQLVWWKVERLSNTKCPVLSKFIYSEMETKKITKYPSWFVISLVNVKSTGRFHINIFVAFSEYMNLKEQHLFFCIVVVSFYIFNGKSGFQFFAQLFLKLLAASCSLLGLFNVNAFKNQEWMNRGYVKGCMQRP